MGVVHDHPFVFEVVDDTPFALPPLRAAPAAEDWLRDKVARDCEIGRLRKVVRGQEKDPTFVSNMILVPKKGAWREVANLVQANTRLASPVHPIPDCMAILNALSGSSVITTLDIKSGFHNIPIPEELQRFCGLITREGVYVS